MHQNPLGEHSLYIPVILLLGYNPEQTFLFRKSRVIYRFACFAFFISKKGGFNNFIEESEYKDRAKKMLARLETNPGPLAGRAIQRKEDLLFKFNP